MKPGVSAVVRADMPGLFGKVIAANRSAARLAQDYEAGSGNCLKIYKLMLGMKLPGRTRAPAGKPPARSPCFSRRGTGPAKPHKLRA